MLRVYLKKKRKKNREIVEPKSFLRFFQVNPVGKNNGGVSTGEKVRESCEECVCVCLCLVGQPRERYEMIFAWWRGNSQIDGIGGSPKKSDAFFFI